MHGNERGCVANDAELRAGDDRGGGPASDTRMENEDKAGEADGQAGEQAREKVA